MSTENITVTILPHPKGCLMRINHADACLLLTRDEALELIDQLNANFGKMPVNIMPSEVKP